MTPDQFHEYGAFDAALAVGQPVFARFIAGGQIHTREGVVTQMGEMRVTVQLYEHRAPLRRGKGFASERHVILPRFRNHHEWAWMKSVWPVDEERYPAVTALLAEGGPRVTRPHRIEGDVVHYRCQGKCKRWKPEDQFYLLSNPASSSRRQSECCACSNARRVNNARRQREAAAA
jgi:hypothetical protein